MTIYSIIVTIALVCALERIGYWKQEARGATFRRKWINWLLKDTERKQEAVNEWRLAAEVLREDNRALACENAYLRARRRVILVAWWRRRQKRSNYAAWVVMRPLP